MKNITNIAIKLFKIKYIIFLLVDKPILTKYKIPIRANILNLFSLINIVSISSLDIETKMTKSKKVNNKFINIIYI